MEKSIISEGKTTQEAIEKGLKFAIREGGRTVGSGSVSNIIE